jgi:tetratricopeptide (TPR) repeat protein
MFIRLPILEISGSRGQPDSTAILHPLQRELSHNEDDMTSNAPSGPKPMSEYTSRELGVLERKIIEDTERVRQLISAEKYDEACELGRASLQYIDADGIHLSRPMAQLASELSKSITSRDLGPRSDDQRREKLLEDSATVFRELLGIFSEPKVDLAQVKPLRLNRLIGLLGEQQNHPALALVFTSLWESREVQHKWRPENIWAIGRRLVIAQYFSGDYDAAIRLAEGIVYNNRRMWGSRGPSTLDMKLLLSQLYSSIGGRYQPQRHGRERAKKYYKKAADLHENVLRAFTDPCYDGLDDDDDVIDLDESSTSVDLGLAEKGTSSPAIGYILRHVRLLKLSIQRLGEWPKSPAEYGRLIAAVSENVPDGSADIEEVKKWNIENFGDGKAEATDDLLDPNFSHWGLPDGQASED